ncbi:MAG: response regulator [Actinobacteria bacterium]|nr:response regulator [Actinomycetota bacterium]
MVMESETKRVLLVDDDHDMVRSLELYLRMAGYDVTCAFGGIGAIEEITVSSPSAVILDIRMPDIDGVDVCRHIRQNLNDTKTPIIALTAVSDPDVRRESLAAGFNEYITKPCDFKRVCQAVQFHSAARVA